ncbi:unnamed protein product, partial [Iphiclides podalirius]
MSAKKETKVQEYKQTDSGYLSGLLSEELSGDKIVEASDSGILSEQIDSGLDLTERLSDVRISDTIETQLPRIQVETERSQDYPPFQILFEQDDDGDTQLHIASVHGCEKSVGTIIKVCPEKSWLDMRNDYGHTALHLAVLSGNAVVTRMLVIAGASVALRDGNGDTPVHLAVATNNKDCLQALLAPVQDQPQANLPSVLNQKNYNGQMCVHLAAYAGQMDLLRTLANHGANMNAGEGLAGWTPLHIAARRGDGRLCSSLLQRGCDPYTRDFAGRTPRRFAVGTGAAHAFAPYTGEDSESDSDEEMYDSDIESLFEKFRDNTNAINVA